MHQEVKSKRMFPRNFFSQSIIPYRNHIVGFGRWGCLSEAVHLGLPVITWRNAWTMPQERYNTQWVCDHGVGLVVSSLSRLPQAAGEMIERLPELHAATARIHNRAVFEVPELLARWLSGPHAEHPAARGEGRRGPARRVEDAASAS